MAANSCSFVRETGKQCGSPAMRGNQRCFFHDRDHQRRELLNTWRTGTDKHVMEAFELPPLETPEEVQICINSLFQALTSRRLIERDAQFFLDTLRLASRNLRTAALIQQLSAQDKRRAQQSITQHPQSDSPDDS